MSDVRQNNGTWDYECPQCEFTSTGWPLKKVAAARGEHHGAEHAHGTLMPSLEDFRAEHNLNSDGSAA